MRGASRDPRNYELMIIVSPDVPEEEIQGVIDRTGEFITGPGGTLNSVNRDSPWGRRRLSYPIRHNSRDVRDGFYTLYQFSIEPHKVEDIEREIRLTDRIIRYLVTQHDPLPEPVVDETAATPEQAESDAESVGAETTDGETSGSGADEAETASAESVEGEIAQDQGVDVVIDEAPAAAEDEPATTDEVKAAAAADE